MLEETQFKSKPKGKQIGTIQNNMKAVEITPQELSRKLISGCSFRPALLNGKGNDDWVSQQIIALDFDANTTIEEELDRCKKLNILPNFGYTSFSHTEDNHKFRLVFMLEIEINDTEIMNSVMLKFKSLFLNADKQTFHLGRLFFGGKRLIYEGFENTIHVNNKGSLYTERVDKISNEYNNTNSFNILATLSQSDEKVDDDCDYNLKALRNRDVDFLRSQFGVNNIEFDTEQEFWYYIYRINMPEVLGMKYYKSFKCFVHDDQNPSASIFENDDGVWIYKCHSDKCIGKKGMNIKQLIETLGSFKSEYRVIKFIKDSFNLSIKESEWSIEQKANLDNIISQLSMGELANVCPQTIKNIRYVKELFVTMVTIAKRNIYGENYCNSDGDVVFFASLSEIAKSMNASSNHLNRISQRLSVLIYHDLIRKLDDDKIPPKMLAKAQALSIKKDQKKRVNFYSIPSWVFEHLCNIETRGNKWKSNGYTIKGASYEMFYRTEGLEVAQYIYPQHKKITIDNEVLDRTTNEASNDRTNDIVKNILKEIGIKDYATEKEIIDNLGGKYGKRLIETQIKKSLQEILDGYDLQRVRANKVLKQQYGIASDGYPFIIVKNTP